MGWRVLVLTKQPHEKAAWPGEALEALWALPDFEQALPFLREKLVGKPVDRVVALHEKTVDLAASLREHFCLAGMERSAALRFRDKLVMRQVTSQAGVANPAFVHVLNHPEIDEFLRRVPAPWMLKPRSEASSLGIRRFDQAAELWQAITELGDEASYYLLEQRVEGEVYHVDSLLAEGRVVFAQAHRYGRPPFEVWNHGGVFSTTSLPRRDPITEELLAMNQAVLEALGHGSGVAHVEFVGGPGRMKFLEAAARVGGANIDILIEKASGLCIWEEWARIELGQGPYRVPRRRYDTAVLMQCLVREEHPDLSDLAGEEVVWKLDLAHHAGLVVASSDRKRALRCAADALKRLEEGHHHP
jgi:biotin carboxylase